jgi:hypothetical protein
MAGKEVKMEVLELSCPYYEICQPDTRADQDERVVSGQIPWLAAQSNIRQEGGKHQLSGKL